ncbi:hypothetical protein [Paenibacillus glycanilyticus]|uniref:DUF4375 domain-containing protein n=1 Tax=Paenibacillus glycanilyticus TaxID=126569 RepID=A0ABQ6GA13_9BACL|nr:hypothetical protein [Paenibacillus glycanilyticus]GLX67804.1 hypothetical protein MU1_21490 [Paenibacillus glycanilyticus]
MGTKFGNLHVKTTNQAEVIAALKGLSGANKPTASADGKAKANLHLEDLLQNIFHVGSLQSDWVSVLNDLFGWGVVEQVGEALSRHIASPVLTCSYFDEDLFEINLYYNGECLTGHLWSSPEVIEDYELEPKKADIAILSAHLGLNHTEQLMQALELENPEEAVQALESTLQLPLWIHSEWFYDLDDEDDKAFISNYIKYDFNL